MAYHVVLESFEGPLDLLLYLISDAQIDIRDINISQITEQYLSYVSMMREMDMERSSQFLAMAARLLEIKSKKLLPMARDADAEEEEKAADDERLLIEQLETYRQYKLACEKLREREREAGLLFYKKPDELYAEAEYDFDNASPSMLEQAIRELLRKRDAAEDAAGDEEQSIERDSFTVQERIFYIRSRIAACKRLPFSALFEGRVTREEVVLTFFALLELIRLNRVSVAQRRYDEEIMIEEREPASAAQ
jgi:segregation and condensation protein A